MVSATPKNTPCMVKWKSPYLQSDVSLLFASNAERKSSQQLTMLFSAPRLHWTVVRMSWLTPSTLFEFTLPQWYTNKTSSFDISPRRGFKNGSSFTQVFTWLFRQAVSFPYSLLQKWIRCCVSILGPGGHLREVWVEVCQDCAAKTFKPWPFSKAPRFSHTCLHDCCRHLREVWVEVCQDCAAKTFKPWPFSKAPRFSHTCLHDCCRHLREVWVEVCQDCAAKTFKPWPFSKAPRFSHTCLHDCCRQVFSFPYSLEQRWSESDVTSVFKAPGEHLRNFG